MSARANWCLAVVACACVATGVVLSHRIEPGVAVKTITLAGDTPALQFIPADSGPHPVALLAHGITASRETLFRFGEAFAAAGFECYAVDLPGHGESVRPFSFNEAAPALDGVARSLGSVDVFLGHSMGAYAGAGSVRDGYLRPRLFIAVGVHPISASMARPCSSWRAGLTKPFRRPGSRRERMRASCFRPGATTRSSLTIHTS